MAEVFAEGIGVAVEPSKLLDDFSHSKARIDAFLGCGGMGGTARKMVNDTCGGRGKCMEVEHYRAQREAWKVVKRIDGADVVLLQDAGIEYFL